MKCGGKWEKEEKGGTRTFFALLNNVELSSRESSRNARIFNFDSRLRVDPTLTSKKVIPFDYRSGILINFLSRRGERIGSINYRRGRARVRQSAFPTLREPSTRSQSAILKGEEEGEVSTRELQVPSTLLCRCTCDRESHTRYGGGGRG